MSSCTVCHCPVALNAKSYAHTRIRRIRGKVRTRVLAQHPLCVVCYAAVAADPRLLLEAIRPAYQPPAAWKVAS